MATIQKSFELKLAYGKEGEHEVGEYFTGLNYSILPLYQFNDDIAPKLYTANTTVTAPDLFVFGNGKYFWVEVKTKNRWIKYLNSIETGCNERHYLEYLKISEITGLPVYLLFNHKEIEPTGYYCTDVNRQPNRIWDGINCSNGLRVSPPMALWLITDLKKIDL